MRKMEPAATPPPPAPRAQSSAADGSATASTVFPVAARLLTNVARSAADAARGLGAVVQITRAQYGRIGPIMPATSLSRIAPKTSVTPVHPDSRSQAASARA